jgi:hypothetical protein
MFSVGDKVRCVNDVRPAGENPAVVPNWVKEGEEYTIRGFHNNDDIVVGVLLEEIENPITPILLINRWQEPAFATWRFEKTQSAERTEEEEDEMPMELQELLEEQEILTN